MLCNSSCEQWRNLGTTIIYTVLLWQLKCDFPVNPRGAMATFVQGLRVGAGMARAMYMCKSVPVGRGFTQLINDVLFATNCKAVWDGKLRSCDNMLDGFSLIQCLAGDWQHDWDDFCTKLWRTADHPGPTCTSLHPAFRPCICACGSACGNSNTIGESVNCKRGPDGLGRGYILYDLWGNSYLSILM